MNNNDNLCKPPYGYVPSKSNHLVNNDPTASPPIVPSSNDRLSNLNQNFSNIKLKQVCYALFLCLYIYIHHLLQYSI
ncbi:unnamed protein product [Schistosoma mattheei]|uniref:Uncharacterized protein n=1 Tax=Schistosoma mattheei TaxID=31246 RepID=A0A183PWW6_9TREM|nr:unnamed protein product [Schistosoma mattheei]